MLECSDEYQLQVPDALMRLKEFETGQTSKEVVYKIGGLNSKVKDGKITQEEAIEKSGLTEGEYLKVVLAWDNSNSLSHNDFILSGKSKALDNGNVARGYCRAGELMVKAIEQAYVELGFRVPITGEYLIATPDEGWGGAH